MAYRTYDTDVLNLKSGNLKFRFVWEVAGGDSNTLSSKIWDIGKLKFPLRDITSSSIRFSSIKITFEYDTAFQNFMSQIETDGAELDCFVGIYLDNNTVPSTEIWRGCLDFYSRKGKDFYYDGSDYVPKKFELKINDALWWFKLNEKPLSDYMSQRDTLDTFFTNIATDMLYGGFSNVNISSTLDYDEPNGNTYGLEDFVVFSIDGYADDKTVVEFLGKLMLGFGANIFIMNNQINIVSIAGETPAETSLDITDYNSAGQINKKYIDANFGSGMGNFEGYGGYILPNTSYRYKRGSLTEIEGMVLNVEIADFLSYCSITDVSWVWDTEVSNGVIDDYDFNIVQNFDRNSDSDFSGYGNIEDTDEDSTDNFFIGWVQDLSADFISDGAEIGDILEITDLNTSTVERYAIMDIEADTIYFISRESDFNDLGTGSSWQIDIHRGTALTAGEQAYLFKIWELLEQVGDRYYSLMVGDMAEKKIVIKDIQNHLNIFKQYQFTSQSHRVVQAQYDLIGDRIDLRIKEVS